MISTTIPTTTPPTINAVVLPGDPSLPLVPPARVRLRRLPSAGSAVAGRSRCADTPEATPDAAAAALAPGAARPPEPVRVCPRGCSVSGAGGTGGRDALWGPGGRLVGGDPTAALEAPACLPAWLPAPARVDPLGSAAEGAVASAAAVAGAAAEVACARSGAPAAAVSGAAAGAGATGAPCRLPEGAAACEPCPAAPSGAGADTALAAGAFARAAMVEPAAAAGCAPEGTAVAGALPLAACAAEGAAAVFAGGGTGSGGLAVAAAVAGAGPPARLAAAAPVEAAALGTLGYAPEATAGMARAAGAGWAACTGWACPCPLGYAAGCAGWGRMGWAIPRGCESRAAACALTRCSSSAARSGARPAHSRRRLISRA